MMSKWPQRRRVITLGAGLALVLVGLGSIGYLPSAQGASFDPLPPSQNLAQPSFEGDKATRPAADSPPDEGEAWEEMHQACEAGNYDAMAKWHAQCHGEEGGMNGGMMGGGMMGSGTWNGGPMGGMGRVTSQY